MWTLKHAPGVACSWCSQTQPRTSVLAFPAKVCHKGHMRRLRDFASIVAVFSDREIVELQDSIDRRREARARCADDGITNAAAEAPETAVGWEGNATD
jgi:hypothetical protein